MTKIKLFFFFFFEWWAGNAILEKVERKGPLREEIFGLKLEC